MKEGPLGSTATIKSYLIVSHSLLYRLSHVRISRLTSQSFTALANTLRRFGVTSNALAYPYAANTLSRRTDECPLLRGRCELKVGASTFELAADLFGEDRFYMPVLLESMVGHLCSYDCGRETARAEISYGMTLAFDPETRKSAIERLMEVPCRTIPATTEYSGLESGEPRGRGCLNATTRGACVRMTFAFACEPELRPARALALGESQLWAGAESLGLVRPPGF
jgi:hypothetical protein